MCVFVFACQGGQCIYSSKEGSDDLLDMNSLLHHLRPYFLHGNNRVNGHLTSKALLSDFVQVERTRAQRCRFTESSPFTHIRLWGKKNAFFLQPFKGPTLK